MYLAKILPRNLSDLPEVINGLSKACEHTLDLIKNHKQDTVKDTPS
jgi:hypothetical protein